MTGRIHACGHHVQRERIRQALRRVDPLSAALQAPGGLTSRRPYSVPGPNSLWHIGKPKCLISFHVSYLIYHAVGVKVVL